MCGICGKYQFGNKPVNGQMLKDMVYSLRTRGPDEQRVYLRDNAGLGVSRLSILDIPGGSQPVFNEDETIAAIFNGEIFNYPSIRDSLSDNGHNLRSRCDSEAIVHLYEEYGLDFLHKLEGMFALAVFDFRNSKLLIARDRIGIKPLYFYQSDEFICFASSVSALTCDPEIELNTDLRAINCYFTYNYFPQGCTPFAGIREIPCGSYLLCGREGVLTHRYWEYPRRIQPDIKDARDKRDFIGLFENVVAEHSRSDVPMGVFLSGGMDSSLLAYYAQKARADISAFTLGFKEPTFDERPFADRVADSLSIPHYHLVIDDNIAAKFMDSIEAQDIPFGEPSFLPTLELAKFAKSRIGVVLSGEGADELFGGYETYRADILAHAMQRYPALLRRKLLPVALKCIPYDNKFMGLRFRGELFLKGLNECLNPHFSWREIFSNKEKEHLYSGQFYAQVSGQGYLDEPYRIFMESFDGCESGSPIEKAMYYDATSWLPYSILRRLDTASMRYALEARVPFLDSRIVELSCALTANDKVDIFKTKKFLKSAFAQILPPFVLNRRKHGFSVPVSGWLRGELGEYFCGVIRDMSAEEKFFIDPVYVMRLFREHVRGENDHSRKLWNIMVFVSWFSSFRKRRQIH